MGMSMDEPSEMHVFFDSNTRKNVAKAILVAAQIGGINEQAFIAMESQLGYLIPAASEARAASQQYLESAAAELAQTPSEVSSVGTLETVMTDLSASIPAFLKQWLYERIANILLVDNGLTEQEERALTMCREHLNISEEDAQKIESRVTQMKRRSARRINQESAEKVVQCKVKVLCEAALLGGINQDELLELRSRMVSLGLSRGEIEKVAPYLPQVGAGGPSLNNFEAAIIELAALLKDDAQEQQRLYNEIAEILLADGEQTQQEAEALVICRSKLNIPEEIIELVDEHLKFKMKWYSRRWW